MRMPRNRATGRVKAPGVAVDGPSMDWPGLRRRIAAATVVAVAGLVVVAALPQRDAAAAANPSRATGQPARRALPERLSHLGNSRQVVVVRAANWSTTYASLVAWQMADDGTWHRFLAPVPARVGWNGFAWAARRVQNSGKTPAGTFRLLRGFGIVRPAGVSLRYQVVNLSDWWPYDPRDPRTYNVQQTSRPRNARWRSSWAEHLATYRRQYRFAVVLDYNLPSGVHFNGREWVASQPANTHKGGGIFLHVNGDGATAGCVSVSRAHMRSILRWLDPADHPRIVMGPRSQLSRL
jgi:L,D-peptidoglycan transpeptidase YkuD (ErfK/YbiS/YcfS/YnhG family)